MTEHKITSKESLLGHKESGTAGARKQCAFVKEDIMVFLQMHNCYIYMY